MIVSFDFDNTITLHHRDPEDFTDYERGEDGSPVEYLNDNIAEKIKFHKEQGDTVYVVTTRYDRWKNETEAFLKEHGLDAYIDGVFFTNGAWKAHRLKKLGVELHHDDDRGEIRRLKYKNIKGALVRDQDQWDPIKSGLGGWEA